MSKKHPPNFGGRFWFLQTVHNDKNTFDACVNITIVHPFHPENGKNYDYLELVQTKVGDRVRCMDEKGNLRIFPVNITNLYKSTDYNRLEEGGCIVSVDDLISLKELVDAFSISL